MHEYIKQHLLNAAAHDRAMMAESIQLKHDLKKVRAPITIMLITISNVNMLVKTRSARSNKACIIPCVQAV